MFIIKLMKFGRWELLLNREIWLSWDNEMGLGWGEILMSLISSLAGSVSCSVALAL